MPSVAPNTGSSKTREIGQQATAQVTPDATPADETDTIEMRRAKARDIKARWMAARDFEVARTDDSSAVERHGATSAAPAEQQDFDRPQEVPQFAPAVPPIEALDEMAGRKEPTFDESAHVAQAVDEAPAAPSVTESHDAGGAVEMPAATAPSIKAFERVSGRREPTFDEPVDEPPATEPAAARPMAAKEQDEGTETSRLALGLTIEALEAASGRREPTFDEPVVRKRKQDKAPPAAVEAEAPHLKRQIELPAMQTRIEARRLDTLRADPQMAAHRRIFPHSEPEEWDVLPPIATSAGHERHKTNWAISLGAVLLIIGITAPAALLQDKRQESRTDDVAMEPIPLPLQSQTSQSPAEDLSPEKPTQSAAHATSPSGQAPGENPSPEKPTQSASHATLSTGEAQDPEVANLPEPVIKPEAGERAPEQAAEQQAKLGPVRDGGELNDAPISAPPPPQDSAEGPMVNLASQQEAGRAAWQGPPMVARPFVPDGKPAPFLRPPTVGTATVPIDGASAASQQGAPEGLRPTLIPQLKPKASAPRAAASSPQRAVQRKPRPFMPPTLEQMFETLADTLNPQGRPPNPTLKPAPGGRK
ncbi:hypothetical protein [Dongia deserti]|uniref:hypothetical protein n=1 Tax=Dongia deserti TaxID=2268030 RepID=UPI0013C43B09|nr:hypothetical protein [Dongia deserti]